MLKGVVSVEPGYAGPSTGSGQAAPTYGDVSTGTTTYVEVVKIEYDPQEIKFEDLLTVFFGSHDPTTLNRQGNDVGTQYRSVIYYTTPAQEEAAKKMIGEINRSSDLGKPIVTEVKTLQKFFPAEKYHKDYYAKHPEQDYCELVINPKLEKVQKKYGELLRQ